MFDQLFQSRLRVFCMGKVMGSQGQGQHASLMYYLNRLTGLHVEGCSQCFMLLNQICNSLGKDFLVELTVNPVQVVTIECCPLDVISLNLEQQFLRQCNWIGARSPK